MKKVCLGGFILLSVLSIGRVGAQTTTDEALKSYFSDANFRSCVLEEYNQVHATNAITDPSIGISQLDYLDCSNKNITSLSGISLMQSLTSLYLYGNNIQSVDLTENKQLMVLSLSDNSIASIDLSKNINLETLYLAVNPISSIDLSNNINLRVLFLNNTNITNLDVSKNTKLQTVGISNTNISNVDLSKNIDLLQLDVSETKIANIDLSRNTQLNNFIFDNAKFQYADNYITYNAFINQKSTFKEYVLLPNNLKTNKKYETSDASIATVDQKGNIVFLKEGTVRIIQTSTVGGSLLYEANVIYVTKQQVQNNSQIKNPKTGDSISLYIGTFALLTGVVLVLKKHL